MIESFLTGDHEDYDCYHFAVKKFVPAAGPGNVIIVPL